jgi:hypothetical protein
MFTSDDKDEARGVWSAPGFWLSPHTLPSTNRVSSGRNPELSRIGILAIDTPFLSAAVFALWQNIPHLSTLLSGASVLFGCVQGRVSSNTTAAEQSQASSELFGP